MTLSTLLLGAGAGRPLWAAAGTEMIAVDTLIHNLLHRTGTLHELAADHVYGPACYRAGACADLIRELAGRIDARTFGAAYPAYFPRLVQVSRWRFCATDDIDMCNGLWIDDRAPCQQPRCPVYRLCPRLCLWPGART